MQEETKWYKPSNRPPYSKVDESFSITVLLFDTEMEVYSIGWFDFQLESWQHIADEDFEDKFVWTYLPKYKDNFYE